MTNVQFQTDEAVIHLNLVEVDETSPISLRFAVEVHLGHPTGNIKYTADDIWFETGVWDEFLSALKNGAIKQARLCDQSEYFVLCVQRGSDGVYVQFSASEPLVPKGRIKLECDLKLDLDGAFVAKLLDSFRSFPVFW